MYVVNYACFYGFMSAFMTGNIMKMWATFSVIFAVFRFSVIVGDFDELSVIKASEMPYAMNLWRLFSRRLYGKNKKIK